MARICSRTYLALLSIAVLAALSLLAGVADASLTALPTKSCAPQPYAYAGLYSKKSAQGIEAVVTTIAAAQVPDGHVAGWIGVGGTTAGPGGQAEWLQAGVNTMAGAGSELYFEVTQLGLSTRYVTLASNIVPGSSYHLTVLALPGRRGEWQVLLNGKPVTAPIYLRGSNRFRPMAMSESWNGGAPQCNGFNYRFSHVRVGTTGSWHALTDASVLSDLGYKIIHRTIDGFTALSA